MLHQIFCDSFSKIEKKTLIKIFSLENVCGRNAIKLYIIQKTFCEERMSQKI